MKPAQARKARLLYKTILRLHRGLPDPVMREIGDNYVREEFRRHMDADPILRMTFMEEWAKYAVGLTKQLGLKGPKTSRPIGNLLDVEVLSEDQILQLYELYQETSKPLPSSSNN